MFEPGNDESTESCANRSNFRVRGPRLAMQVMIIHQEVNFSYGRLFFAVPIILRSLRTLIAARAFILISST
jgi:hypothetical protein